MERFLILKILLHDNQLCERGTTNSVLNYARALQARDQDVTIAFQKDNPGNVIQVVNLVTDEFDVVPYGSQRELEKVSRRYDASYFQKSGNRDGIRALSQKVLVHSVFQEFQPHGTDYFYISEWLAQRVRHRIFYPKSPRDIAWSVRALGYGVLGRNQGTANAFKFESIPYICDMPAPELDVRDSLGIPSDAFVMVRYGGMSTFDIDWMPEAVTRSLERHPQLYFLAVNTPHVVSHPRAKYLDAIWDNQVKANLLGSANLFFTARRSGESFGLAHLEALQIGLKVLAYGGGWDRNHIEMLGPIDGLYLNANEFEKKLQSAIADRGSYDSARSTDIGDAYRPYKVGDLLLSALQGK